VGRIKGGHGATGTMVEVSAGKGGVWDEPRDLEWRVDGMGWDSREQARVVWLWVDIQHAEKMRMGAEG
jgi:hypothetical protein